MLPRQKRITRALFAQLLKERNFRNSEHFTLRFLLSGESPRFGVSVSKKVSKSAVVRNGIRRRVYDSLPSYPPLGMFLVVAKPGSEKVKGEALCVEIETLLKNI